MTPAAASGHIRKRSRKPTVDRAIAGFARRAVVQAVRSASIDVVLTRPAQMLAISAGSFPDVVAYPEHGYAWVATRDPDPELLARGGDPGIIARFEIPIE
jgi:hypothetical protein